jgi:hypothetical protein
VPFTGWCSIAIRCQNTDQIEIKPASRQDISSQLKPGLALVEIGLSMRNSPDTPPMLAGLIAFDPATGRRQGKTMIIVNEDCPGTFTSSDACTGVQYRTYVLAPGTYALGWFGAGKDVEPIRQFADFARYSFGKNRKGAVDSYTFSEDATVRPNAPFFTVAADQAVYVGTLAIDMAAGSAVWSSDLDFAAAKGNLVDRLKKSDEPEIRMLPERLTANPGTIYGSR